jgi:CubicO group peptidase (beta-lactamase class C family)
VTDCGLRPEGVGRLHELMARHVDAGEVPGLAYAVARDDDVRVETIGTPAFDEPTALDRSAIFRIASLTKPVTAVATMSLIEAGVLRLDQAIDELVPELADRRVLRAIDAPLDDTVPAHRPITVEDLLSSRFGIGSVMVPPGTLPIQRAEAELGLQSIGGPPWPPGGHDVDSWIAALGSLPLMYQPGEQWLYNTSAQVLGVVLARATGDPVETVMRDRIFEPLGMRDTGFTVPAEQRHRLTTFYRADDETGVPVAYDEPATSWWATPQRPDTSGWLVSTIDDYWTFVSMVLGRGTSCGIRILSPESVALMTTDRLTAAQREASQLFLEGEGWGLGMTTAAPSHEDRPLPTGVGWDGGTGTTWRSNLRTGATGILFTQRQAASPEPPPLIRSFWAGVNAAVGDAGSAGSAS